MGDRSHFDVVIVGAGIAGSALAAALSGKGLAIALLEAQPLPVGLHDPEQGIAGFDARVSSLTPRSRRLLERIGVWEDIEAQRLCPYRHMTVWDAEGTGVVDFDSAEVDATVLGYIVENRVIVSALMKRVRDLRDVTVLNPARLSGCQRIAKGNFELQLEAGNPVTTDLLVAADGALSRVREMLDFPTREWNYGHRAIVTTVQVEHSHSNTAWQRFLPTGPLAFLPLPDIADQHFCSIVWSLEEALVDDILALDDATFCRELQQAFESRLGEVQACTGRFAFPLRQRHAIDYVGSGVALVGDAAHTIHPLAGQGINLGLGDVAVLAEELLAALDNGEALGELAVLRRYQRRRKGENLAMMAAMDGFKHIFGQRSLPLRWLRNAGMHSLSRLGPVKRQIMRHAMGLGV